MAISRLDLSRAKRLTPTDFKVTGSKAGVDSVNQLGLYGHEISSFQKTGDTAVGNIVNTPYIKPKRVQAPDWVKEQIKRKREANAGRTGGSQQPEPEFSVKVTEPPREIDPATGKPVEPAGTTIDAGAAQTTTTPQQTAIRRARARKYKGQPMPRKTASGSTNAETSTQQPNGGSSGSSGSTGRSDTTTNAGAATNAGTQGSEQASGSPLFRRQVAEAMGRGKEGYSWGKADTYGMKRLINERNDLLEKFNNGKLKGDKRFGSEEAIDEYILGKAKEGPEFTDYMWGHKIPQRGGAATLGLAGLATINDMFNGGQKSNSELYSNPF